LYDDLSWLALTDRYAFVAWGDSRPGPANHNGENNVWVARLRLHG
jgi:hypothetical protein